MNSPAKSRSRIIAGVDPRMDHVVNDNMPPAFPGHELSDLDGVLRPPAAEAVIHYARLAHIASYPMHPDAVRQPARVPAMDALPENNRRRRPSTNKRTAIAGFCSLLFHAAVFAALTTAAVSLPEDPVEEAGDTVSVVMLGHSDADQLASGEKSEVPRPKPDEVVAEAVQPDVTQPTTSETAEATPAETQPGETPTVDAAQPVQPTEAQPSQPLPETVQPDQVQPTQTVTQASPETVVSPEPEVLASQVPSEPTVAQPMATEIQPEEMKPAEAPPSETPPTAVPPETVQPSEAVQPVETAEATPSLPPEETVTPIEKPTPPAKPVQKPKDVVRKQPPKPAKVLSGSAGENERDSTRGSSEGTEVSEADHTSVSAGGRQGAGGAEVANYIGKVQSRIDRSVRRSVGRAATATTVRVRLTIGASGQLSSLSLARSSGVADLDNAVMEGMRRAAPFPPLPSEWGKPSWSFTQEVQVTGN